MIAIAVIAKRKMMKICSVICSDFKHKQKKIKIETYDDFDETRQANGYS